MEFELAIFIERAPDEVFRFLRDLYQLPFHEHPVVPVYEKLTPGPVAVGTHFREGVRTSPFTRLVILSEVTALRPEAYLAYRWRGPGMHGELVYEMVAAPGGTELAQRQTLILTGPLRLAAPFIGRAFAARLATRLAGIRAILEGRARFGETG